MAVLGKQHIFTLDCVATLAAEQNVELPVTLAPEPAYRGDGERARMRESARAELAESGELIRGEPSAALVETVRLLCTAGQEVYGFAQTTELSYSLHAGASGRDAVFAVMVHSNGRVLLRPARAEGLAAEVIAELPECPPARGTSLSAPEADLRPGVPRGVTDDTPAPRGEARRLLELFNRPRLATSLLYAGNRSGHGAQHTSDVSPVTVLDLEDGRWLSYLSGDGSGPRHVVATPGSWDALSTKLHEVAQNLRPARR